MNTTARFATLAGALMVGGAALAAPMTSSPADSWTVTNYYKQPVYDGSQNKIGQVDDVLIDKSGKITGLVLGVGGFLGMGEKDVIVNFDDVHVMKKDNNSWWLTVNETKDSLKAAPGFSYNRDSTTWQPAKS